MFVPNAKLVDFEVRSRVNLKTEGLAKYAHCPSTQVLCGADLCPHTGQQNLWLPGQPVPDYSQHVIYGFNVQFEKVIWEHILKWPAPMGWYDIAAHSRYAGCPGKLETACEWFNLSVEFAKMAEGSDLIQKLCKPIATGKQKGQFREPADFPELFQRLYAYCAQDNVAALAILKLLPPWPQLEQDIWKMTMAQNERGCPVDLELCHAIIALSEQYCTEAKATVIKHTNGEVTAATQIAKLKKWLNEQGVNIEGLDKNVVAGLLDEKGKVFKTLPQPVIDVLRARQIAAPASLKKFKSTLEKHVGERLYHNFIYCGGGATGRFSGGGKDEDSDSVQLQNLFRGSQDEGMLNIIKLKDAKLLLEIATALGSNPIREMQNSVRSLLYAG